MTVLVLVTAFAVFMALTVYGATLTTRDWTTDDWAEAYAHQARIAAENDNR